MTSRDPTSEREAAQILSRASWRIRRSAAEPERSGVGERGHTTAISTHPLSILPVAAGVTRVLRFQPEIRGESYLAPGKVRQGVRTCGLKPQDTSPRTVCCFGRSIT